MTQQLASGQVIAARYELLRPLRSGAADTVLWLARDLETGREVVFKRLEAANRPERTRIYSTLAALEHPALALPVAQGTGDGWDYEISAYLPGGERTACT